MLVDDRALTEQAARLDALLERIESVPDAAMRATMAEIVQGLLTLYGEGLARMLAIAGERGAAGDELIAAFSADELIGHLLLLHDLHPLDVGTRVTRALDKVRPYLQSHGGNVELVGIDGGVARLRLQGSCHGCPSSTATLKLAIEEAIRKAAPELEGIEAEGASAVAVSRGPSSFVPVSTIRRRGDG